MHPISKVPWNEAKKDDYTDRLEKLLEKADTDFLYYLNNEDVDRANDIILNCIKESARFKKSGVKTNQSNNNCDQTQPSWWDEEWETLKLIKYRLLRSIHRTNNPFIMDQYLKARKQFKNTCSTKKSELDRKNIEDLNKEINNKDSKDFWSKLNKMLSRPYIKQQGNVKPKDFHDYFENLLNPNTSQTNVETDDDEIVAEHDNENTDDMLNYPITSEEILQAIRKQKKGKACGSDGISSEFYINFCLSLSHSFFYCSIRF